MEPKVEAARLTTPKQEPKVEVAPKIEAAKLYTPLMTTPKPKPTLEKMTPNYLSAFSNFVSTKVNEAQPAQPRQKVVSIVKPPPPPPPPPVTRPVGLSGVRMTYDIEEEMNVEEVIQRKIDFEIEKKRKRDEAERLRQKKIEEEKADAMLQKLASKPEDINRLMGLLLSGQAQITGKKGGQTILLNPKPQKTVVGGNHHQMQTVLSKNSTRPPPFVAKKIIQHPSQLKAYHPKPSAHHQQPYQIVRAISSPVITSQRVKEPDSNKLLHQQTTARVYSSTGGGQSAARIYTPMPFVKVETLRPVNKNPTTFVLKNTSYQPSSVAMISPQYVVTSGVLINQKK